jgi:hypothetical protein
MKKLFTPASGICGHFQKGICYSGIRIFNGLPKAIKDISSKPNKFKISLKHYLLTHSFYSLDQFYSNSNI